MLLFPCDREIDMAMIEVEHLRKILWRQLRNQAWRGFALLYSSLKSRPLKRSRIWPLRFPRADFRLYRGQWCWKSTTIKMLTGILKPTSGFVGLMARFRRTIARIMSRILEWSLDNEPSYGGIWLWARDLHGLEGDLRCARLALP